MKTKLLTTITLTSAVLTGILVAILNKQPSWSQQHNTDYDFLLYFTLGMILLTFTKASDNHPQKEIEITAITWLPKRLSIKLKHGFMTTAFMFLGIIVFGVNHRLEWVVNLHLIFTGLAILTGYLTMITYPTTKRGHRYANIGFILGITGFLLGFVFNLYSVSWAEVIVSIPLALFLLVTYKKVVSLIKNYDLQQSLQNKTNSI